MSPEEPKSHPTAVLGWHLTTCIDALKGCQKLLSYRHHVPQDMQTHGSPSSCADGAMSPEPRASVSATDLPMLHLQFSSEVPIHIHIHLSSLWCLETSLPKLGEPTISETPKRTARSLEICRYFSKGHPSTLGADTCTQVWSEGWAGKAPL